MAKRPAPLQVGPDRRGGVGVYAAEDVPKGAFLTYYSGPVVHPQTEAHSKTHSLHILPDMTVPVARAKYRVIDGKWLADVLRAQGALDAPMTPPAELCLRLGSMTNSSRDATASIPNARLDTRNFDVKEDETAFERCTDVHRAAGVRHDLCGLQPMYACEDIRAVEEILWDYAFRV